MYFFPVSSRSKVNKISNRSSFPSSSGMWMYSGSLSWFFIVLLPPLGVQIPLQDPARRNLIDHFAPLFAAHVGGKERPFRRNRGKPFVPEDDRKRKAVLQPAGQVLARLSPRPDRPVHVAGESDDDGTHSVFCSPSLQALHPVGARPVGPPRPRGGPAQMVAHRHSDPFFSHIQSHDPGGGRKGIRPFPPF